MAKTYPAIGPFTAGDILTAATMTDIETNLDNQRVPPMVRAVRTSDVSFTSGNAITFQSVTPADSGFDTDGMWSAGAPTRITIQTDGVYQVTFTFFITGTSVTQFQSYIRQGGTTLLAGSESAAAVSSQATSTISVVCSLSATNYLEGLVNMTGSSLSQRGTVIQCALQAVWVGQES